jgi:signal transduction histidine kinase
VSSFVGVSSSSPVEHGTTRPRPGGRKHEVTHKAGARYAVALITSVGLSLTLVLNAAEVGVIEFDDLREGQLETAAAMVLVFVAAVLLGRFRHYGSRRDLLLLAAVMVLAVDNLLSTFLTTAADSLARSGFATWAAAGDGVLGAVLLAGAAVLPNRPVRRRLHAAVLAIGTSGMLLVTIIGLAAVFGDSLPGAFEAVPMAAEDLELLSQHPALLAAEASTAVCYGVAAFAFAWLADRKDDDFMKWLSVGCAVASVAFVNYALFPSEFTELLYSGDLFFLAAVVVLLYGAVREISNVEADIARTAVLAERRRMARDLHDGVAQELAFISSQANWFLRQPTDHEPLAKIMDAVERAIDESRGAIAALNRPIDEPLDQALEHAASDVADRVGARLDLDLDKNVRVTADWRDALLRITREAVGNAVRHGRARTVSLELSEEEEVILRIADDGQGFDPSAKEHGLGLTSMRERTRSLGGRLTISSDPGHGTVIEVTVP